MKKFKYNSGLISILAATAITLCSCSGNYKVSIPDDKKIENENNDLLNNDESIGNIIENNKLKKEKEEVKVKNMRSKREYVNNLISNFKTKYGDCCYLNYYDDTNLVISKCDDMDINYNEFYQELNQILSSGCIDSIYFNSLDEKFDYSKLDYSTIDEISICEMKLSEIDSIYKSISKYNTKITGIRYFYGYDDDDNQIEVLNYLKNNNLELKSITLFVNDDHKLPIFNDLISKNSLEYIHIGVNNSTNIANINIVLNDKTDGFNIIYYGYCSHLLNVNVKSNNPYYFLDIDNVIIYNGTNFTVSDGCNVNISGYCSGINGFNGLNNAEEVFFYDYDKNSSIRSNEYNTFNDFIDELDKNYVKKLTK